MLKTLKSKTSNEPPTLIPASEHPAITNIDLKLSALESVLESKTAKVRELNQELQLWHSGSSLERLTVEFLENPERLSRGSVLEQIRELHDEIRALRQACVMARGERGRLVTELSSEIRDACKPLYRTSARRVLRGMLDVHSGNSEILTLRGKLEKLGYAAGFLVPCGLAPWPFWGHLDSPSSAWHDLLRQYLLNDFISQAEADCIAAGGSFEP